MPNFTPEQANTLLIDCIDSNLRHAGYERTIALRQDYHTIVTGVDYDRFLSRYAQRETKEEFDQRLALTYQNLSATASPILRKAGQISRVQDIKKGINYAGTSERDQRDLQGVLDDFGGEGQAQTGTLDDYLTRHYDEATHTDPNAFILLDFLGFNAALGERARPYGVWFGCESIYHFRYTRGVLDYLLVRVLVDYKNLEGVAKVATDLICYAGIFTTRYYQVADGRQDLPETFTDFKAKSDIMYRVVTYLPGIEMVPAVRLGDLPDSQTRGLTCVSRLFHAAMDQFRELINLKSQNDIVTRKHGFPRRYERAPLCPGEMLDGGLRTQCIEGKNPSTGQTCQACGGSGFEVHRSEQDTIRLPLNGNEVADDLWDLSKLSYVEKPELETITSFDQKIRDKQAEIYVTVYSSEQQVQINGPQTSKTATEYVVSREDQNNTLLPIADYKSNLYKQLGGYIAALMSISGEVEFLYEFPRDLKLTSADEILSEIADKSEKVASPTLEQLYDDYYKKVHKTDTNALQWYYFLKDHIPFYLTPKAEFEWYVGSGYVTEADRTRRVYCDTITADLRINAPDILNLSYEEQETKIVEIVNKILSQLPKTVNMSQVPTPQPAMA